MMAATIPLSGRRIIEYIITTSFAAMATGSIASRVTVLAITRLFFTIVPS
jgi:hypothetical protein